MQLAKGSKVLFLDAQTTGLTPRFGEILELGFGISDDPATFGSQLFPLRRPDYVLPKVWQVTGLNPGDLATGPDLVSFWRALVERTTAAGVEAVVIHYAQFEKPFLQALHREAFGETATFPFPVVCTQRFAHKLLPALPSRTLRALVGHFGFDLGESHRALDHLLATEVIWRNLAGETPKPPEERKTKSGACTGPGGSGVC